MLNFREKYDMTLPDGWMSIIEENPRLFSIAKDALMDRVYPNLQSRKSDNGVPGQKANDLDELVLPWNEKHWNIFVTSVSSTVDIWGRLIGPDYSVIIDLLWKLKEATFRRINILNRIVFFFFRPN